MLPHDDVVLAVPAAIAARIVPGLVVPDDYAPIVNAHFRYDAPTRLPPFLGIVGGTAEWVFRKRDILSVTVSAADRIVGRPADELRDVLWRDVARALALRFRADAAFPHRQGAPGDVPRHPGAAGAPSRRRQRHGTIFT